MSSAVSVKTWDLPIRLFHWALALSCVICWATATQFEDAMRWHFYAGYTTLALLLFRLLWGRFGSSTARFSVATPQDLLNYARTLFHARPSHTVGHNPVGTWSAMALIASALTVSVSGLFANDAVLSKGPLAHWVGDNASDHLSDLHQISFNFLVGMVVVHLTAIVYYRVFKREDLVTPMLTGKKQLPKPAENIYFASNTRALVLFLVATALVGWIATR